MNRRFFKIAHRGASAYEPENTMLSFERALEMSADLIEFDVRLSLDGHPVVIHDKTVNRTTNGQGLVKEMTLGALKKLDAGKGEKIPTLEEVINFGKGKTRFVIELKVGGVEEKVINQIRQKDLFEEAFVVSKHREFLKKAKYLEPRIKTGYIAVLPFNTIGKAKECFSEIVAPLHFFVTKSLIEKARENGIFLFTWIVDNPSKAKKLRDMGVDGIVTNKPDII